MEAWIPATVAGMIETCSTGNARALSMTHVLHRAVHKKYPVAAKSAGIRITDETGKELHRRVRRRGGVLSRPRSSRRAGGHARAARQARLRAHQLLHDAGRRGAGRPSDRARPARHVQRVLLRQRLGGHRGLPQDGAALLRRDGRAAAHQVHLAPAELSRHHARRAVGRRPHAGPRAVRRRCCSRCITSRPCFEYRDRRADETPEAYGARLAASWRPRSSSWAGAPSPPSSPRRSSARRSAPPPPCPAISSACARSATVTASC